MHNYIMCVYSSRQLESEVEWAKEVADRLERVNQSLLQVGIHIDVYVYYSMYVRNIVIVVKTDL